MTEAIQSVWSTTTALAALLEIGVCCLCVAAATQKAEATRATTAKAAVVCHAVVVAATVHVETREAGGKRP
jgi:hypothetical protein